MDKSVQQKTVFRGRVLELNLEDHQMPDGRRAQFEIIRHPGGAAVLPILDDGRILLLSQFRPAVGRFVYEIPAGRLDEGETADQCAARELIEETGYRAGCLEPLGGLWSAIGFCDEFVSLFLARELTSVGQELEPDEIIELVPMSLDAAVEMVESGEIGDSKTQIALLRYARQSGETR